MTGSAVVRAYLAGQAIPEYELVRACCTLRVTNVVPGTHKAARERGGSIKRLLSRGRP